MERTRKQEQAIVTHLFIFLLLSLVLVYLFIFYLLPKIKEIEVLKSETFARFEDTERVEKKGMTYEEFKGIAPVGEQDLYLQEIINNVTPSFYENNLVNNDTSINYMTFLKEQTAEIDEGLPIEKKNEIISSLLPIYSEFVSDLGDGTISEFKFINYIESIMETFRLSFNNQVGIQDVKILEGYSVGVLDSSLETNIYYIPVSFDLTGTKSDILDFLYFAEHIGKIVIDGNDLYINEEVTAEFRESFRNKRLSGTNAENIFSNQMFDVESITFPEYIDSELIASDKYLKSSLVSYIKSSSDLSSYKVSVKLRFYVKGLPVYKIENYIREFILFFTTLQKDVSVALDNSNISGSDKQKITDLNNSLLQFSKTILPNIQQGLSLENINEGYNLVNRYYGTIKTYRNTLDQINSNLGNTAK